jgi:hypothetical protein
LIAAVEANQPAGTQPSPQIVTIEQVDALLETDLDAWYDAMVAMLGMQNE